jgi:hypothetical protein
VAEQKTVHRANIFSAKYLEENDDRIVVSCSGEGLILVTGERLNLNSMTVQTMAVLELGDVGISPSLVKILGQYNFKMLDP